ETGLLPGALIRNAGLTFVCKTSRLTVETTDTDFTGGYNGNVSIDIPIAHHDGNYIADPKTLDTLNGEGRVAFRYHDNPNGSVENIAGVLSENYRILGMMPHPERAADVATGLTDGRALFQNLILQGIAA
ncbi:MAG: phosphoribosylformylglycinamidine synthase subunit PurQ, partial [Pseudomonadota bacterium]